MSLRSIAVIAVVLSALVASASSPQPVRFSAVMHKAKFDADGSHAVRFEQKGSHPALHGGPRVDNKTPEATSMHLSQRPRLHPELILTVTSGSITRAILDYGEEAFAIPAGKLSVKARHTSNELAVIELPAWLGVDAKSRDISWPAPLSAVGSMAAEMVLELTFDHQEVTTFTYTLENGIPADVYESEQMYDLQPHNSTMLTKFMIRVQKGDKPKLSVWVSRKPIAPDFTLIVAVDGDILAQANIEHDPTSTDALGYDVDVTDDLARLLKERVDFAVHFYERPRAKFASLRIDNLRDKLNELSSVDQPLARINLETSNPGLFLQLQYHRGMNFVGLRLLQPSPMSDVQLSLFRDADGERVLFLREGDDVVPYYHPDGELQYGWDDALPTEAGAVTVDGHDLFNFPVDVELWYNAASKHSIAQDLERWITTNGGRVAGVDLSYLNEANHSWDGRHPLVSTQVFEEGDVIASIPYSLLVTSSAIERGTWSRMLSNNSDRHRAHVEQHGVHGDAEKIMHLTTAVHLHLFDESMNFRPYFNTFSTSANKLAPFFTEDERNLFNFDPQIGKEMSRMQQLWDVEFETLEGASEMLPRPFTRASYFHARSQVETRLLNLSGELVLAPIVDLMTHDDAPNAKVEYNDEAHVVSVIAGSRIGPGTPITIDFGHNDKTGLDFLIQFGFVPPKAIDASPIDLADLGASYLTSDIGSRTALARTLASKRRPDDDDLDFSAELGEVTEAAKQRFSELSKVATPHHPTSKLAKAAESLLRTEREVLSKHLQAN